MPARLSDDVIMGLLEMEAESQELDRSEVGITDELEKAIDAYEAALETALEDLVERFPPADGNTIEDLEDEGDAAYNVLMTLRGEGVGIWDGRWDQFYNKATLERVEEFLKKRLQKYADDTGSGSLNEALMNAAYETAGGEEDEEEEDDGDTDVPDEGYLGNPRTKRSRQPRVIFRVRGTADAYKDRDRDFRYGSYTLSRDVLTEAEARQVAEDFIRSNKPQGEKAVVWIEESNRRTGDFYSVARWAGDTYKGWQQTYSRQLKPNVRQRPRLLGGHR